MYKGADPSSKMEIPVKEIQSTAAEGMGTVIVELELGADARKVVDEVKSSVDAITTFPVEAEKPIIRELTRRMQVADISVFGDVDLFTLKATAERVRDELTAIPGITQVEIVSAPPYEISIEVSELTLRRHGLPFDQIADAVRRSSLDLPGGSVRTEGGEILLRTIGQAYRGTEYENLVLWTRADGSRLRVGDVATVVDGFAETDQFARFDRTPTMLVSVFRTGDQSVIEIGELIHAYIEDSQTRLPDGISMTIWQDSSERLSDQLSLMLRNGATGFVLVFITLALFLDLRLALWVSLGIPLSFLGAIALMPSLDISINMMSMFGLVALSGVVVNDSLIMVDFINRNRSRHVDIAVAVREAGVNRFRAILLTSLTTFFGLAPLMTESSFNAAFMKPMAVSLAFGVLFATFITLILVPTAYMILDDIERLMRTLFGRTEPVDVEAPVPALPDAGTVVAEGNAAARVAET